MTQEKPRWLMGGGGGGGGEYYCDEDYKPSSNMSPSLREKFCFLAHITTRCASFITKTKTCPIKAIQRTLSVPKNEQKDAKENSKSNSICNTIHEIWSIFFLFCFCSFSLEKISELVNSSNLMN